jgi:predicted enzyme related to lactoylglutathione lyase
VKAGGKAGEPMQAAPGVVLVMAEDTEGNGFTLRGP